MQTMDMFHLYILFTNVADKLEVIVAGVKVWLRLGTKG